jgi:hypothetical protein
MARIISRDASVRAVLPIAYNPTHLEREDESLKLFPYPNLYDSMYTLAL